MCMCVANILADIVWLYFNPGTSTLVGAAVWGGYQDQNGLLDPRFIGWSFILAVVGACCLLANGINLAVLILREDCYIEQVLPFVEKRVGPIGRPKPTGYARQGPWHDTQEL